MKPTFLSKANVAVNTAVEEKWLKARVTRELTAMVVPLVKGHIDSMRSDIDSAVWTLDNMNIKNAPTSIQTKSLELIGFLEDAEGRLNTMSFKNSATVEFGSEIKKTWLKKIFKDDKDVKSLCGFTDYKEFQLEQDKIIHAVRTESKENGAKKLMAESKVNIGKAATGTESQLLNLMRGVKNAQRYELLSKVDLYINSGHAQNDLELDTKAGRKLRTALTELDKHGKNSAGYKNALDNARNALYSRFDDLFLAVQVKKQNDKYVVVDPPFKAIATKRKTESPLYSCQQNAPPGYIDSVIKSVDGKTYHAAIVTSVSDTEKLKTQGEQHIYQGSALKEHAVKEGINVKFTTVIRATHTDRKVTNDFLYIIGVLPEDTKTKKALDTLTFLTVLCAMPGASARSDGRYLMVGKSFDLDAREYVPQNWGTSVMNVILPVLEKLSHEDTPLNPNGRRSDMLNQVVTQLTTVLLANVYEEAFMNAADKLHKIADKLKLKLKEAALRAEPTLTNEIQNLSLVLSGIHPNTPSYSI